MAVTQIRNFQIKDQTITREKLVLDFLNGSDLDLTNGNNNATITGLSQGVNPKDAVNKEQLDAFIASVNGGVQLRGPLAGAADLTGNSTGNAYADGGAGYIKGDKFIITSDGSITVSDGSIAVNNGDSLMILNDVASDAAITLADVFKIDNTESADILREADVVDNLTSTSVVDPLSANQGRVLDLRLAALEALGSEICGEAATFTAGTSSATIANTPLAGTLKVYRNGLRLCEGVSGDYTVSGTTITFADQLEAGEIVLLDYRN